MNRGIRVLQTHALPLGYVTILKKTPYAKHCNGNIDYQAVVNEIIGRVEK